MNEATASTLPQRRPRLVWVIFAFVVLTNLHGLVKQVLMLTGSYPVPEGTRAMYEQLQASRSWFEVLGGMTVLTLNLVAAFLLILLRRQAYHLFAISLLLSIGSLVIQFARGGPAATVFAQSTLAFLVMLIALAIGWSIYAAICVYTWHLRERGVLK